MDEFEREQQQAQDFFAAMAHAALSFNRAWAHFRLADAIIIGRSGATVRVIEDPDSFVPVRRVSGGVLRG